MAKQQNRKTYAATISEALRYPDESDESEDYLRERKVDKDESSYDVFKNPYPTKKMNFGKIRYV